MIAKATSGMILQGANALPRCNHGKTLSASLTGVSDKGIASP